MHFKHVFLIAAIVTFGAVSARGQDTATCIACHEDKGAHNQSVHQIIGCSDCHQGFSDYPHPDPPPGETSSVARPLIVNMCARCHGSLKFVEDNRVPGRILPVVNYRESVHGEAVAGGQLDAAVCTDCHKSHEILGPSDPESSVSRRNVPGTCGSCHTTEGEQYQRSVHGVAHAQGQSGVPTCTDCHGIHSISRSDEARKSDAEMALGQTSCSRCHQSEVLSREYALPMDRVRTFLDSYHGLAASRGSVAVANCSSCHGLHEILASADPSSSINSNNLPRTCGRCHPGASENFPRGQVHLTSSTGQAVIQGVTSFYIGLIVTVIGLMFLHNALDFRTKIHGAAAPQIDGAFTRGEAIQHAFLAGSFIILVVSGFALKWPGSVFELVLPGGEGPRRWIHRGAAVVMVSLFVYHVVRLITTARGKTFLRQFLPRLRDVKAGFQNFLFNAKLRQTRPVMEFPSYIEKVEYWSLIWGTIIMAVTGLLLWFENTTMQFAPLWVMNLLTIIHYYEAILATLAILVWHIYFVVLDPTVYPLKSIKRRRPSEG